MREIKFRAWDIDALRMVELPFYFEESNPPAEERFSNEPMWRFYEDWTEWEDGRYRNGFIMQYTGLKDKNRKKIYEGDVLGVGDKVIGHVIGGVRGYCYDVVYKRPLTNGEERWSLYGLWNDDYPNCLQIIGNIYENPELLQP